MRRQLVREAALFQASPAAQRQRPDGLFGGFGQGDQNLEIGFSTGPVVRAAPG